MNKLRQRLITFMTLVMVSLVIGGRVAAQDNGATNQPPVIDAIAAQSVDPGQTIMVGLNFSDPDGDTVSISALSDNPAAAVSVAGNQLAVTGVAAGSANITVTADDGRGGGASTSFAVTINAPPPPPTPDNNPPVLGTIASQTLNVGQSVVLALSYSDPDGDAVTLSVSSDNAGVASVAQTSATEITVNGLAAGAANISITADDGKGGTASASFAVSVSAVVVPSPVPTNNPPVIAPINPQVVTAGQSVIVPVGYSDPDGDAVTVALVSDNPAVATVSQSSAVELSIAGVAAGTANITMTVDDGQGGTVSASFAVTVNAAATSTPEPTATDVPATNTPEPTVPSNTPSVATTSIIVRTVAGLNATQQQQVIARNGGTETSAVAALRMHFVDVPSDTLDAVLQSYRSDAQVMSVELDKTRDAQAAPSDPNYPQQWALPKIGWDSVYGAVAPAGSSVLAILDTGIDASHPELSGLLLPGYSAFEGGNALTDPNGHGTEMAGIAAAHANNGEGIAGVAYSGVWLMSVQVLAADGTGQDSDIINGIVWATDNGAKVILMSFSNPGFSPALQAAVDYAWDSGVVIVAATGNDSVSTATYPAGDRGVMGISATDSSDALAGLSNYGSSVFMAAPGENIATTTTGGGYATISGTSASAAYVAASAALMRAVDPGLSNGVVVGRLARNADPAGTQIQTGNGRLNLARALSDTSTTSVKPVGAPPTGNGGPFVGPYVVAARTFGITFAGTGGGTVTIAASSGSITFTGCAGSTGSGSSTVTLAGTCTTLSSSTNSATLTLTASPNSSSASAWSSGNNDLQNCSNAPATNPCSVVLNSSSQSLTVVFSIKFPLRSTFTNTLFGGVLTTRTINSAAGASAFTDSQSFSVTSSTSQTYEFYSAPLTAAQNVTSGQTAQAGVYLLKTSGSSSTVTVAAQFFDYDPSTGTSTSFVTAAAGFDCTINTSNNTLCLSASGSASARNLAIGHVLRVVITISRSGSQTVGGRLIYNGSSLASSGGNQSYLALPGTGWSFGKYPTQITWANPADITYGTALSATQLNAAATAGVAGSIAYTPASGTVLGVGNAQNLVANFTPTDTTNYSSSSKTVTINVNKKALTVTVDNVIRPYGDSNPIFTAVITGFVNGETLATSGVTGSPLVSTSRNEQSTPATYTGEITAALGTLQSSNYSFSFVNGTLTITKAPLTVTADAKNRTYGSANPTLTATITGFKNGQTLETSDVIGTPTISTTAVTGSAVGTYPITVANGTLSSARYSFTFVNGILTIDPKALTVTANNKAKNYGDVVTFSGLPIIDFTTVGLVNSDTVTSVTLDSTGAPATATVAGSPYPIVPSGAVGTGLSNYTISYVNGSLNVQPLAVIVTADAQSKTYGDVDPGLTYTVDPELVNGDSFSGALTRDLSSEDVGSYAITQGDLALSDNYDLTFVGSSLEIIQKTITVNATVGQSKIYGDDDPTFGYTFNPVLVDGDSFSGALNREGGDPVGTYAILDGNLSLSNNYILNFIGADFTITPRPITITADAQTKVYGAADPDLTYQITAGSLVSGDNFTGGLGRAGGEDVGPYAINQGDLLLTDNYDLTFIGANLTITARPIEITADPQTKVYGADDPDLTYQITAGSLISGDFFSGALDRAAGEDVGTYAINVGGLTLGTNYVISLVSDDLTITPRGLTITAEANDKVYDGTNDATATLSDDRVLGDTLIISYTAAFNDKTVEQDKPVTITIHEISGADAGNYSLISATSTAASITPRDLTVTATADNKTYDGSDTAVVHLLSDKVAGDIVNAANSTAKFDSKNVGINKPVTVTGIIISGADSDNYNLVNTATLTTADITARQLTFTAAADDKVYDGTTDATVSLTDDRVSGDVFNTTFDAAFDTKHVSTDKLVTVSGITITGTDAGNYAYDNETSTTANITAKGITVTADPQTKVYGAADPILTYTSTPALIAGDSFSGALGRATGQNVGTYAINQGTLTLGTNYAITFNSDDLTITPKALTITPNDGTKTYGDLFPFAGTEFTASGLVSGDSVDTVTLSSDGAAVDAPVDSYDITASDAVGTGLGNYAITYIPGILTVTPRPLNIKANLQTKVYGTTFTFNGSEFSADNLVNGDTIDQVTLSSAGAPASAAIGDYDINVSGAIGSLDNYTITYQRGNLSVTKRALVISATADNKIYDRTMDATVTLSDNRVPGDDVTVVYGVAYFNDKNVGTGKTVTAFGIAISGPAAGNYSFNTTASTTADITPVTLIGTITAFNKVYDGNTSATINTRQLQGVLGSDDVQYVGGTATFADKNAGDSKTVTATGLGLSGADAGNYTVNTTATALADITKVLLNITITADDKVYDGTANATFTFHDDRIGTDDLTIAYVSALFDDKHVGTGKGVTVNGISVTGDDVGNYSIPSSATDSADITARPLTITAQTNSKVYDTTTSASAIPVVAGLQGTDTVSGLTESYDTKHVGTDKILSVDAGYVVNDGNNGANYDVSTETDNTGIITAASLTVTATGIDKDYDGTTNATVTLATNKLAGDDVTASYVSAAFADKNVGSGKPVSVSNISISGADAGNYSFNTTATTTATISAIDLTVSATADNKTYDGSTTAVVHLTTDALPGDVVTTDYTSANFATKNVGSQTVTILGISIGGDDAANYTLVNTTATATAEITVRTLNITANDQNKPYGVEFTFNGNQFSTGTGELVSGESIASVSLSSVGAPAATIVGSYPILVSDAVGAVGTDLNNYAIAYHSGTMSVGLADQTIDFGSIDPKTYGDDDFDVSATASSGLTVSFSVGISDQCTISGNLVHITGAGECTVTASQAGDSNYAPALNVSQMFSISKANAFIVVNGYTGVYDGLPHGASGTATGVESSPADLSSLLSFGDSFTNVPGGTANWTFAGNDNYKSASDVVQIVINQAASTTTVTVSDATYDGNPHGATASVIGVGGLNASLEVSYVGRNGTVYGPSTIAPINAGDYTASATFDGDANHAGSSDSKNFSIAKTDALFSIVGYTGVYNGLPHGASGTATGVESSPADLSSLLNFGNVFVNVPGGVAHWTFAGNGNYNASSGDVNIVITKADATITVAGYTGVYDGAAHGASGTAKGVQNETLDGLDLGASFTNVPGGTANWTFTDVTGNYNDASGSVNIVIAKADAIINVLGGAFPYDGNPHGASGTAFGVESTPADLSNLLNLGASYTEVPGGIAHWTFAGNGNYNASSGDVTIAIGSDASVTTVVVSNATYDGNPHGASASVTGVNGLNQILTVTYEGRNGTVYGPSTTAPINAGDYTASATFDGDANHAGSSDSKNFSIAKADALFSIAGYTGVYNGLPHGASGSATGVESSPADLSSLLSFGASFTNVPGGVAHWTFAGNDNYNASSGDVNITITKADATITIAGYTDVYDGAAHGASGTAKGVQNEPLDGLNLGASFTNVPGGTANWTFTDVTGNYNDASGSVDITITKADQTIDFAALSNKTFGDPDFTVSATASSGLAVTFTVGATDQCTISGSTVHITGAGSCTVTAHQTGDANYNPAPDVSQSFTIAKANQTITFIALSNKTFGDADFTVSATASSGLAVTFTVGVADQCTISGNTVHITGAGSCTVTAHQTGDANYNPAPDVSQSFTIAKANQTITFAALGNKTVGDPDFTVSATASSGLAVTFTVGATDQCTISGNTVHITGAGSCTVTAHQVGNANYNPAPDVARTFTIAPAATTAQITITMTPALQKIAIDGKATFTIKVTNTGSVKLTNVVITDALASSCNKTFSSLNAGASQTYTCTKTYSTDTTNMAIVTAKPPSGPNVTANASAVVDVLPKITASDSPSVNQVIFTGAPVTFTYVVKNNSKEPVTITALTDSVFGTLAGSATCKIGTVLQPNASCSFTLTMTLSGTPGASHLSTFTATVVDNENNSVSDTNDAKVTFYWNSKKVSTWKNNPTKWPTSFTVTGSNGSTVTVRTTTTVRSVFIVPASSTCVKSSDTLLQALGYGTSTSSVCSATQNLLREAVAAILNEKYYGTKYPTYNSAQEIISAVNTAIASNSRTTMSNLANQLKHWNDGGVN